MYFEQLMERFFSTQLRSAVGWLISIAVIFSLLPETVAAEKISSQDLSALSGQLQRLGWRIERTSDGDLLLWPPGQQLKSDSATLVMQPGSETDNSATIMNLESLDNQLSDTGWQTRTRDDGSLLLDIKPQPTEPRRPATSPQQRADWLDELGQLLQARGWRVERDKAGSLRAYPRKSERSGEHDFSLLKVDSGDLYSLRQSLLAAGWRLEQGQDGSLLLYPRATSVPQQNTQTLNKDADTVFIDLVAKARVRLPVDSAQEAHRIATVWLEQQPHSKLKIGRINRQRWVYLVDVYQTHRPYYLHNQLAIRYRDGLLVPLL